MKIFLFRHLKFSGQDKLNISRVIKLVRFDFSPAFPPHNICDRSFFRTSLNFKFFTFPRTPTYATRHTFYTHFENLVAFYTISNIFLLVFVILFSNLSSPKYLEWTLAPNFIFFNFQSNFNFWAIYICSIFWLKIYFWGHF